MAGRRDPTRFRREISRRRRRGAASPRRHKGREDVWRSELAARSRVRKEFAAKEEREGTERCVGRRGKRSGGGRGRNRERHEAPRASKARFWRWRIKWYVSYDVRCDAGSRTGHRGGCARFYKLRHSPSYLCWFKSWD